MIRHTALIIVIFKLYHSENCETVSNTSLNWKWGAECISDACVIYMHTVYYPFFEIVTHTRNF